MRSDPRKLLYDLVTACGAIAEFCRDRSLQHYRTDLMLRSACERQFEIIGEAMTRLRDRHGDVFEGRWSRPSWRSPSFCWSGPDFF